MTRRQCAKCPWKVSTDPYDIPDGYSREKHAALSNTINEGLASLGSVIHIMACHESTPGNEIPCAGWLANQLGPGNNIGLRILAMGDRSLTDYVLVGKQHMRFEDTLPRKRRTK